MQEGRDREQKKVLRIYKNAFGKKKEKERERKSKDKKRVTDSMLDKNKVLNVKYIDFLSCDASDEVPHKSLPPSCHEFWPLTKSFQKR